MANAPARTRLQDLEQELDTWSLRRFAFVTRTNLGLGAIQQEERNDADLRDLKVKVVVMGGNQLDADSEFDHSWLAGLIPH